MKRHYFIVICLGILLSNNLYSQTTESKTHATKPFTLIKDFPVIKDSLFFIKTLKSNYALQIDEEPSNTSEQITNFIKIKLYGSSSDYYLVELDWHHGSMASYPWKYQLIFDSYGNNIAILNAVRYELLPVFPNANSLLLSVTSTSRGNGEHALYKIRGKKLVNTIQYPKNICIKTYDSDEEETINDPTELKLTVKDINRDGYNDLLFSGKLELIMAVSKDNTWYDTETINGKKISYSSKNPFKEIPITISFVYNPKSEMFIAQDNYSKYCSKNLYKLIYHIAK